MPETTLETIKEDLVTIEDSLETPAGGGIRSLDVALRQELDLYTCVRPIRYFKGIESPLKEPEKTSVTIFRENTEDTHAGIEWNIGTEEVKRVTDFLQDGMSVSEIRLPETNSIGIEPISQEGSEHLIHSVIKCVLANNLTEITLVHKGDIQKFTEGGFRSWSYDLIKCEYAGELASEKLVINDIIADNSLQQTLLSPEELDVVALTNPNGDYVSDAPTTQIGGIGVSPGANINYLTGHTISEATHRTVSDITGKDIANPCSALLSSRMLFDYIGWTKVASLITAVVERTFVRGQFTVDLTQGKVACSTSGFAAKLIEDL